MLRKLAKSVHMEMISCPQCAHRRTGCITYGQNLLLRAVCYKVYAPAYEQTSAKPYHTGTKKGNFP